MLLHCRGPSAFLQLIVVMLSGERSQIFLEQERLFAGSFLVN
jgi:hypothetical protein